MRTRLTLVKALMLAAMVPIAALLVGCQPEGLVYDPQSGRWVSPLPTTTSFASPLPTPTIDDDLPPTLIPSPTLPPFPTPLPTPVVTPIPTVAPPIIPEAVGKDQQPFWIIYWQGNEIWRIDDQGKERQLLLDTYKQFGQWLTGHPMEGSDCCWDSVRVMVSPDGQKLAVVVVDRIKLTYKGEPFTFSIYLFDIRTGDLRFFSKGASPVWSPDGKRIAFVRLTASGEMPEGGLWIGDLETDQIYQLIEGDPDNPTLHVSYWMWSPESLRIVYRYSEGSIGKPGIWIKSVADSSPSYLIPNVPADFYPYGLLWTPDGQHLLGNVQEWVVPGQPMSLWTISVNSGERQQLTRHMDVAPIQWSPDQNWLTVNARRLYEREEQPYDLWLLSADGTQLLRVTSAPPQDLGGYWSPDGTRLIFQREGTGLSILSLVTGDIASPGVSLAHDSRYNYAIGEIK